MRLRHPSSAVRFRRLAVAVALLVMALTPPGPRAASTDPTLAIGQVVALRTDAGTLVEIHGILGFDDLLQVSFPLNLVLHQSGEFVRYPIGGAPQSGSFAGLLDGLETGEIVTLEALGSPEPAAQILRLQPRSLTVLLPASFSVGPLSAVLYVEVSGEGSFLSNAVTVDLSGAGGAAP
ncbi:MAG: hypothetical protein ACE5FG_11125 [Myxococcota bacterium]